MSAKFPRGGGGSKPILSHPSNMCYIGVTEGKIENLKKEGKMRIIILIFIYTIHFAYLKVTQNLKTLAPIGTEKSLTEIFMGEKEK